MSDRIWARRAVVSRIHARDIRMEARPGVTVSNHTTVLVALHHAKAQISSRLSASIDFY